MRQSNSGGQNVLIGSIHGCAQVTIEQGTTGAASVALTDHAVPVGVVSQAAGRKWGLTLLLSPVLPLIALLADVAGVIGAYSVAPRWILPAYLVAVLIMCLARMDEISLFLNRKAHGAWIPLPFGRAVKRGSGDQLEVYRFDANCTYPGCQGKLIISEAPEREIGKFFQTAKCSVGEWRHGYEVDPNMVASPHPMDPRPLPKSESSS